MAIGWAEWGEEAFARCRALGKPMLLSLTARWCHACHRYGDEPEDLSGLLRDQALALDATLIEYRLSGAPELLPWAERAASFCIQHLWDDGAGAFRAARHARGVRLPPLFPLVANGEMAMALIDLAAHAERPEYRRYAERLVQTLGPQALGSPAGPAVALAAQRFTDKAAEADLYGDSGDGRARDLARIAIGALGPACP